MPEAYVASKAGVWAVSISLRRSLGMKYAHSNARVLDCCGHSVNLQNTDIGHLLLQFCARWRYPRVVISETEIPFFIRISENCYNSGDNLHAVQSETRGRRQRAHKCHVSMEQEKLKSITLLQALSKEVCLWRRSRRNGRCNTRLRSAQNLFLQ